MRLLLFGLLALAARASDAEPWFPAQGPAALHQRLLSVERPAVVLLVSHRPGWEDLPLLAYLRFHAGARVAVAYVTNGEAAPADTLADVPLLIASQRKEEAYRAATLAGAEAWFCNMPDPGAVPDAAALASGWPADTLVRRLTTAIRTYQPDCIVVARDRWTAAPSPRDSVVREAVSAALRRAASTRDTSASRGLLPWNVSRLLIELPAPMLPREFSLRHPALKISSAAMAETLAACYRSLRLTIGRYALEGRAYRALHAGSSRPMPPASMTAGLPAVPARLRGVPNAIRRAVTVRSGGLHGAALPAVSAAVDSTERVLSRYYYSLTPLERRLTVAWKNGLEEVRCTLLGLHVDVAASESLVTDRQLFYLNVRKIDPLPAQGSTEIIFPLAMNGQWYVNDTLGYRFPVTAPERIPVLTPETMEHNAPVSLNGLTAPTLRTPFPFFIVHKDPRRERNFSWRGEVLLQVGPRRSFELRTPLVLAEPGARVVTAMQNFSRDPFAGTITLRDTGALTVSRDVRLDRKDQILLDTLALPYSAPPAPGSYPWVVELSGRGGRRALTARSFALKTDTAARVALLSAVSGSPVAAALREMRLSWSSLRPPYHALPAQGGVLLIDRDALSDPSAAAVVTRLRTWVREGGRVVVLPQDGQGALRLGELCGLSFEPVRPLMPGTAVTVDSSAWTSSPNVLGPRTWSNWVEARAWYRIVRPAGAPELTAAASADGLPLLGTVALGRGRVTLVALDLWSQLTNLHEGAYRLFANLLSSP